MGKLIVVGAGVVMAALFVALLGLGGHRPTAVTQPTPKPTKAETAVLPVTKAPAVADEVKPDPTPVAASAPPLSNQTRAAYLAQQYALNPVSWTYLKANPRQGFQEMRCLLLLNSYAPERGRAYAMAYWSFDVYAKDGEVVGTAILPKKSIGADQVEALFKKSDNPMLAVVKIQSVGPQLMSIDSIEKWNDW